MKAVVIKKHPYAKCIRFVSGAYGVFISDMAMFALAKGKTAAQAWANAAKTNA